jgi:hypothetical protein
MADQFGHPLGDGLRRAQRFAVPDPHDLVALAFKPSVTLGVTSLRLFSVVPRTVDLDHQSRAVVCEIRDVSANRSLPANVKMQLSQLLPQPFLGKRHLPAKALRPRDGAGRVPVMLETRWRSSGWSFGVGAESALPAPPSFHPIPTLPH